ncbi:histidine triad nucleotide-binding protein [Serpentinicella alkaliphila]|uniref:Histidine triad (HIT) family protein n=1 Tax=Serpentinicella alkaliphila TaxID=1734049 RepID=A0A4V2T578_9FIRM|nr:histidine triad nucleotide-binding protein [Serpentinicella alkaliphila]QUH26911.1 histidine triad nucleotide-binding protein [Serpentinicella alkaliphila]TCQ08144.1 histidine triad (HIT) family protein [Serpentinicella alkaliphila]
MSDCLFCKIVNKEIPATIVYEDNYVVAFNDISPQAPKHVLVIPKKHIASFDHLTEEDNKEIIPYVFTAINKIAKDLDISEEGYRVVNNCGKMGGQTVGHIHFHLLGGRQLMWPPG